MKTYFRGPGARITHILAFHNEAKCGKRVGTGSRFDASDLPSGSRMFRVCEPCRIANRPTT